MDVMLEANESIQLATLTDQDLRIDVVHGRHRHCGFPARARHDSARRAGGTQSRGQAGPLFRNPAEYTAWRERVTTQQAVDMRVAQVRFEGLDKVNPNTCGAGRKSGRAITSRSTRSATMPCGWQCSTTWNPVAYRLGRRRRESDSVWMPNESSVGHDVLRPSIGIYAAGAGDYKFLLGLQHVRHWLNDRGGSGETPCSWVTRRCSAPVFTSRSTWPSATSWNQRCLLRAPSKICTSMAMPSRCTDFIDIGRWRRVRRQCRKHCAVSGRLCNEQAKIGGTNGSWEFAGGRRACARVPTCRMRAS